MNKEIETTKLETIKEVSAVTKIKLIEKKGDINETYKTITNTAWVLLLKKL